MVRVKFQVSKILQRRLNNIPENIKKAIKGAIIKSALRDMESPAKINCRVDTGRLRASIHTEYTADYGKRARGEIRYISKAWSRTQRSQIVSPREKNRRAEYSSKIKTKIGKMDVIVGTDVHYAKKIERLDGFFINAYESSKTPMNREIRLAIRRVMQGGR